MSTNLDSATARKEWCVMVYFAADIDLESAAMADLKEMKAAGSSSQVDLLAQLNSGGSRAIRRYHLQKNTYLEEDVVADTDDQNRERLLFNVDAKQDLVGFIDWCVKRSPAEHYALVLWGHGQGWKADDPNPCAVPGGGKLPEPTREMLEKLTAANPNASEFAAASPTVRALAPVPSISLNLPIHLLDGGISFLTNADLKDVLAQAKQSIGKNLDVLGMDACLMAMAEICCQVDASVDYLVASQDVVPDESWPYNTILKLLVANAEEATAEDLARVIVWKFVYSFGQKKKFVTQSICQLGRNNEAVTADFTSAVARLVDALRSEMTDPETRWATLIARAQAQSFYMRDFVDLYDFCALLAINCPSKWVSKAAEDVMKAIGGDHSNDNGAGRRLVIDYGTYGVSLKRAFGVSVFFPCVAPIPPCYQELEFCKRTKWNEFLTQFVQSPAGRVAVLDPALNGNAQPSKPQPGPIEVVPVPTTAQPAIGTEVNANAMVATATVAAPAEASMPATNGNKEAPLDGGGIKTTYGDRIKTTYGDIVKTVYNEPIKTPQLPSWGRPTTPKLLAKTQPAKPVDPAPKPAEPTYDCNCNCGHRS